MAQTYSMPERRGIPNWLAAALILLCIGVGGYFAYEYGYKGRGSGRVETVAIEAPARPQQNGGWLGRVFGGNNGRNNRSNAERPARVRQAEYRPDIPEGVSRSNMSRAIYARKGNVAVRGLADDRAADPWSITIEFLDAQAWVPKDQVSLGRMARALMAPRLAEHVQLTEEQKKKLIEVQRDAELGAEEKAQFESMFRAWDQAGKADPAQRPELGQKILAAVEQAAARHLPEARLRVQGRAEQITKLLSAEQLRKAREGPQALERAGGGRRAATRPATRPAGALPATRPTTLPAGQ
jgi:hypothetical protein